MTNNSDELLNPISIPEPPAEGANELLQRIRNHFGDDIGEDELPIPDVRYIDDEQAEG